MTEQYDVVVIGAGAIGASAAHCLKRKGVGGVLLLASISKCAVERRVFLVGANPTQQLSLSAGSGRGGSWR